MIKLLIYALDGFVRFEVVPSIGAAFYCSRLTRIQVVSVRLPKEGM